jgi:hypothetical protein
MKYKHMQYMCTCNNKGTLCIYNTMRYDKIIHVSTYAGIQYKIYACVRMSMYTNWKYK